MKRALKLFAITSLMLSSVMLSAQESPFVGTWKLNTAKTKYTGAPAPKSETRTVVAQGPAVKVTFEGVNADGSKFSYSYTTALDGKPQVITGTGVPGDPDSFASKRVNASTYTTTWLNANKEVGKSRTAVSKDGKVTTITASANDANGKPVTASQVFEKQ
jgi:hypothetical protein